jgi:hypothetical protein
MAEDNQTQSTLDSYQYDTAASGMEKYRETAVAFDNLIVQVGRAIAAAQESMDLSQVNFQRQVAAAVKEGKLRRLEVPPINAYTMPETTLYLKMGLSIDYSEESKGPALSAVPLNATTTNRNDIDIESATEIRLRFVSVPQSQEPPGAAPSVLTPEQVREIVEQDERVAPLKEELEKLTPDVDYKEDSRLWIIVYLEAGEARLVVLVDDRTSEVAVVIDKKLPPTDAELAPIEAPVLENIEPAGGKRGDILTIHGDNFLTLAGQTVLSIDDRPVPPVRFSMKTISFKVPGWAVRGDIKITTPLGSTGKTGAFTPIPTFERFEPKQGAFDALRQRGTWLSVYGNNLRHGCNIEFATGAQSKNVQVISPGQVKVEVPEDAGTGPLTLVFGQYRQSLVQLFFMLPRVDQVTPRQARVGEEVTLTGNFLANVTEVVVGEAEILCQEFTFHTSTRICFLVPPGASDGPIRVRETISGSGESSEISTRDIFYVVPRITGFGSAVGVPGNLLTIHGEGLDPDPDMMSLIFEARTGISEAPVLAVTSYRKSLTTRVPMDAATGFVLLLRKRVYSDSSPLDTSDLSVNKLTILTIEGAPSDLVLDERFDSEELDPARWTPEVGTWSIDAGMLASAKGTARLKRTEPLNLDQFSIYADILNAERFGFSMVPAGGSTYLQVWVDLLAENPALTWTRINTKGQQEYLGGIPLAVLSGQNHLVQLNVKKIREEEKELLELAFLLDQEEVHTYRWDVLKVGTLALLADSINQRWDNVVILKGDYLSLPEPDLYRFGSIPEIPELPGLKIDTFEPAKGAPGTEVKLTGGGLDAAVRVFFGGVEAEVIEAAGTLARVKVPAGARTGPIEVRGRAGMIVTTRDKRFLVPPEITGFVPERILAGRELRIMGTNLPTELDTFVVEILDQSASVVAAAPSMLTVLVPDTAGKGKVTLGYEGFTAEAPTLLEINRETLLWDLVEKAENAVWTSGSGEVRFGVLSEDTREPSVQLRPSERLEDDRVYVPVLYVHPPAPDLRALQGTYPELEVPQGRVELRMGFGMLWSAAPASEEAADVDGVVFEIGFKLADSGEEITLLPRVTCVHDGSLERFVIDAGSIAGKKGQLKVSIYAGRTGLRDDAAIVNGKLVQVT